MRLNGGLCCGKKQSVKTRSVLAADKVVLGSQDRICRKCLLREGEAESALAWDISITEW